MAKHLVNLDAMIPRGDFESGPETDGGVYSSDFAITLAELEKGKTAFSVLRKPDFQRETKEWKPEMVVELVKNFLDKELIPSIILWKSPTNLVYVIDGAHRLSALVAWVNDDYGNGKLSQAFFSTIPNAQRKTHAYTKELIESTVGSYAYLSALPGKPEEGTQIELVRGRGIAGAQIASQLITNPDPAKAEASFYRINQGGAIINDDELEIIRARRWPQAMAARALLRAGTGHKYWKKFTSEIRAEIESIAKQCFDALYEPELPDTFRTLDLPLAGRGYTSEALGLLYQYVHIANGIKREPIKKRGKAKEFTPLPKDDPQADKMGETVVLFLKQSRDLAMEISSKDQGSLGLHPAVYSYTATSKFLTSAFFAQALFFKEIKGTIGFLEFTKQRERFEDFLVKYKYFVNRISHDFGAGMRSAEPLLHLYRTILQRVTAGDSEEAILTVLFDDPRIKDSLPRESLDYRHTTSAVPTKRAKSEANVRNALEAAERCPVCNARMHPHHRTIDHVIDRKNYGSGKPANLQPVHAFCNGSKDALVPYFGMLQSNAVRPA